MISKLPQLRINLYQVHYGFAFPQRPQTNGIKSPLILRCPLPRPLCQVQNHRTTGPIHLIPQMPRQPQLLHTFIKHNCHLISPKPLQHSSSPLLVINGDSRNRGPHLLPTKGSGIRPIIPPLFQSSPN